MPLPEANQPWPPRQHATVMARMAQHRAWYAGDPRELARLYARDVATPRVRPSQLRGGVVGTLARMWWGRPVPLGEPDNRVHVGTAGDLASTSADLLFGESPTWRVPDGDTETTATQDALDQLAEAVQLDARLNEAGEVAAALGGVYLRSAWDRDVADHPLFQAVHSDNAFPEFAYGMLRAVNFAETLDTDADSQQVWRHIERHEPGVVLHRLFVGTPENLGRAVDLQAHPATAGLAGQVETPDGLLMVSYVPNMLPNVDDTGSYVGRSDYARSEGLFDRLDEVYTSWIRDVRLAKGRLIAPSAYLENRGPGQGAAFDPEREAYEGLHMPPLSHTGGAAPITVAQFGIRVEEHRGTARDLLTRIVSNAGYSPGTFGLDESARAVTATEVKAHNRRSFGTRGRKITYFRPALAHQGRVLLAIARAHFGAKVAPVPVEVAWPDGVSDDLLTLANTAVSLRAAEAASDETIVRTVHPDWSGKQVKAEAAAIAGQRQALLPDPGAGFPA